MTELILFADVEPSLLFHMDHGPMVLFYFVKKEKRVVYFDGRVFYYGKCFGSKGVLGMGKWDEKGEQK